MRGYRVDMTMKIVHIMIMIRINIHEAKTHLSKYLDRLRHGEVVVICKRNVPVAELRAVPPARKGQRPIGLAKGEYEMPGSFFDPLPEDVLAGFDGRNSR